MFSFYVNKEVVQKLNWILYQKCVHKIIYKLRNMMFDEMNDEMTYRTNTS